MTNDCTIATLNGIVERRLLCLSAESRNRPQSFHAWPFSRKEERLKARTARILQRWGPSAVHRWLRLIKHFNGLSRHCCHCPYSTFDPSFSPQRQCFQEIRPLHRKYVLHPDHVRLFKSQIRGLLLPVRVCILSINLSVSIIGDCSDLILLSSSSSTTLPA